VTVHPVIDLLRRPTTWLGLLVTTLSLIVLLSVINFSDLSVILGGADLRFIVLGIGLLTLTVFVRAFRWQAVLRAGTPLRAAFDAENIGMMINNLLPLRLGEPARALVLTRTTGVPVAEGLSSIVIIRVADMIAILTLLGTVIPAFTVSDSVRAAGYGTLAIAGSLTAFIVIGALAHTRLASLINHLAQILLPASLSKKLSAWAADFLNGLAVLKQGRRLITLIIATGVLWGLYALTYHILLMALVPHPPLAWAVLATCTASLSTAVPSSPAYVGVYDAAVAFTLSGYIGQDTALGYAIILHSIDFIIVLIFGVISLVSSGASLDLIVSKAAILGRSTPKELSS